MLELLAQHATLLAEAASARAAPGAAGVGGWPQLQPQPVPQAGPLQSHSSECTAIACEVDDACSQYCLAKPGPSRNNKRQATAATKHHAHCAKRACHGADGEAHQDTPREASQCEVSVHDERAPYGVQQQSRNVSADSYDADLEDDASSANSA